MSPANEMRAARDAAFGMSKELANRLFDLSQVCPADAGITSGCILSDMLDKVVEHRGRPSDLGWLIQILTDCAGMLAATLRAEYLAQSDGDSGL